MHNCFLKIMFDNITEKFTSETTPVEYKSGCPKSCTFLWSGVLNLQGLQGPEPPVQLSLTCAFISHAPHFCL